MRKRLMTGAGLSAGAVLGVPAVAQADDFRVTNLNDEGTGSLREAIEDSETNAGADRVLFRSKLSGELTLETTLPDITQPVAIVGPGARRVTVTQIPNDSILFILGASGDEVSVSGLTLTGGHAIPLFASGGAIASNDADLTVSRSTIRGNTADSNGGGIAVFGGSLEIESSTISGNLADRGGGIYFTGDELSIRNSTVSGNSATTYGGGMHLSSTDAATAAILNSTVTENRSDGTYGGGGLYENNNGATIRGTIVAGNTADVYPDLDDGPWTSAFSLFGSTTDIGIFNPVEIIDQGGNLLNVDPKLKPLANNGGPTDTHAFKKSPAKNKIPKSQTEKRDQRGAPRKGKGDIGAYELVKCRGVIVNRVGTAKKDKLKGTKRKDGILGLGGNDKLSGKKGRDGLCGGRGKDKLKGGPGKDKLDGGPGRDKEIQ